jgi:hypothetical protein
MMLVELVKRGSDEVLAVACGTCGLVYSTGNRDLAGRCCVCTRCGLPVDRGRYEHSACAVERQAEAARQRDESHRDLASAGTATRILETDYAGPVFWDGHGRDGYFENTTTLREWCAGHDEAVPAWVHACSVDPFSIDAQYVVEYTAEECHEGVLESIGNVEELQALINGWIERQEIPPTWNADMRRVVVLTAGGCNEQG